MNPDLDKLNTYPFVRLAQLKSEVTPPERLQHIAMSIGEPKHAAPQFILDAIADSLDSLDTYPLALGIDPLRVAVAGWLTRRFDLPEGMLDPQGMVLPLNGTREGLFAIVQTVVDRAKDPAILMPNPFYQIYEGGALLAGAEPVYLNTREEHAFLPDLDAVDPDTWHRCQLLFLCSPGNPTGAVMDHDYMTRVIELADEYDFIIAADECYADIYPDEDNPPPGLLETCARNGRTDFSRCVVFHSLSKRSNVPGLRSGFCAGDPDVVKRFLDYRTYHGCAVPPHTQLASIPAWQDDEHVVQNRAEYRKKFAAVLPLLQPTLDVKVPDAAFYLFPETPVDDERFTQELYATENVTVLPGSYLARDTRDGNPGWNRVRISLVAEVDECVEAAERINNYLERF